MNPYLQQRWTPAGVLGRAAQVLRGDGVRSLFFKVLGELVYRRLVVTELRCEDVAAEARCPDHQLVRLDNSALTDYLSYRTDLDEASVAERIRHGHECNVVLIDGHVAQASWAAPGIPAWISYLDCEIELGTKDVFVYEFYVHPSYRGRKLCPAALAGLLDQYRARGFDRVIWAWVPENTRAVSLSRHWNHRILGNIGYWQVGRWRKYFTSIPRSERPPHFSSRDVERWRRHS